MGIGHWFRHTAHKAKKALQKAADLGVIGENPASEPGKAAETFAENQDPTFENDDASTDTEHTT